MLGRLSSERRWARPATQPLVPVLKMRDLKFTHDGEVAALKAYRWPGRGFYSRDPVFVRCRVLELPAGLMERMLQSPRVWARLADLLPACTTKNDGQDVEEITTANTHTSHSNAEEANPRPQSPRARGNPSRLKYQV